MVGAIVLSPTDAASQKAVVGSAKRVVVAGARVALDRSYSSRVYLLKLHHALRIRRSTLMDRSALRLTFPPRYTNSFVWLYI